MGSDINYKPNHLAILVNTSREKRNMSDKEFLIWMHNRLTEVHNESPLFDYMHKLRAIIKCTPADEVSPNMGTGNSIEHVID